MAFSSIIMLPLLLLFLAIWAGLIYLLILLIRALRKYLRGGEAAGKKRRPPHLGRGPQGPRMRCQMTRSSWRRPWGSAGQRSANGRPARRHPSTSNPLALAKLFGVPAEELLHQATGGGV